MGPSNGNGGDIEQPLIPRAQEAPPSNAPIPDAVRARPIGCVGCLLGWIFIPFVLVRVSMASLAYNYYEGYERWQHKQPQEPISREFTRTYFCHFFRVEHLFYRVFVSLLFFPLAVPCFIVDKVLECALKHRDDRKTLHGQERYLFVDAYAFSGFIYAFYLSPLAFTIVMSLALGYFPDWTAPLGVIPMGLSVLGYLARIVTCVEINPETSFWGYMGQGVKAIPKFAFLPIYLVGRAASMGKSPFEVNLPSFPSYVRYTLMGFKHIFTCLFTLVLGYVLLIVFGFGRNWDDRLDAGWARASEIAWYCYNATCDWIWNVYVSVSDTCNNVIESMYRVMERVW